MNNCKVFSLSLLLSSYCSAELSGEIVRANQSVTDLIASYQVASEAGRFNLENVADIAVSGVTGLLYLSVPGDLAVTRRFAGIAVFELSSNQQWAYHTTINRNNEGENQLQSPYGFELADNNRIMIVCDSGLNSIILLKNQNPSDSSGWQKEYSLDTAASSLLVSPRQLALNEGRQGIYVISDQAREWYYWQCSKGYSDCGEGYRIPVPGILSAIDSLNAGDSEESDVVVADRENNQLTVYRHRPDSDEMTIVQVIKAIPSLQYPAAVLFLDHGRSLMVTARESGSLLIFTRTPGGDFGLRQVFGPDPVNAEELEDFVAPAGLIAGSDKYDFMPVYIAAETSSSITVLHRLQDGGYWHHHQTLSNDGVLDSTGIRLLALAPEALTELVSVGAHTRDMVFYQVSARPQFDQSEYQFDYFENDDSPVGMVNVTVPDGGEVIKRLIGFADPSVNLTVQWQSDQLSLRPELPLDQYPNPVEMQLTAIDQEFQSTSADVSVMLHSNPGPQDYTKYYIIGGVVAVTGTVMVAASGAIYNKRRSKKNHDNAPATAEQGLTGGYQPEAQPPGEGGCMGDVELLPAAMVIAGQEQEQEPAVAQAQEPQQVVADVADVADVEEQQQQQQQQQHTTVAAQTQEPVITTAMPATASASVQVTATLTMANIMPGQTSSIPQATSASVQAAATSTMASIMPSPTSTRPPLARASGAVNSLGYADVSVSESVSSYEEMSRSVNSQPLFSLNGTPTRTTGRLTPTTTPESDQ